MTIKFIYKVLRKVPGKYKRCVATCYYVLSSLGLPWWLSGKNLPAMQEIQEMLVQSLGWEDSLQEGMATHCSILAWRIPWTEEPGGL